MKGENEVINQLGYQITHDAAELWKKTRDVVWFNNGDHTKPQDQMRFGFQGSDVMGDKHALERPRFVNSILEIILLAKEVLDED